jgi:hypothetical protein
MLVGTSRCDVSARCGAGGISAQRRCVQANQFRHLTLRSVTGTAQRAGPYHELCRDADLSAVALISPFYIFNFSFLIVV